MLSYYERNKERIKQYQSKYYRSLDFETRRNKVILYEQANLDKVMARRKHYYNTIKMKQAEQQAERIKQLNECRKQTEIIVRF